MADTPEWDDSVEAAAEPLLGTSKSPHLKPGDDMPPPDRIEVERLKGSLEKLSYRAWLWLQHHDKTYFAPLAKYVLSGGPEGIWVNKPLKIVTVVSEIEQFYATKHGSVSYDLVEMARRSAKAFHDDITSIDDLIKKRRVEEREARKALTGSVTDSISEEEDLPAARSKKTGDYSLGKFDSGALVVTKCSWEGGDRKCGSRSEPGSTLCVIHGGKAYLNQDEIQRVVRAGQERILEASGRAIDTVLELMDTSVNDGIRLKAAEMLLDRAGYLPGVRVEIDDKRERDTGLTPAQVIEEKMKILAERNAPVDAEIVDEGPDIPQLPEEPEAPDAKAS